MRRNRRTPNAWQGSTRRVATHAIVISIHLGAWLLFFGDVVKPWSSPQTRVDHPLDSLAIRLIPASAQPPAREPLAIHFAPPRRPSSRKQPDATPMTRAAQAPVAPTADFVETPPTAPLADYIPGGNLLRDQGRSFPPAVRLPGSGTPIVPGLHLIDPRMQGAAGVARALQSLFGVTNPHCTDVEVWRGMTTEERLARHISSTQVEHTAEEYHCGPA